MSASPPHPFPPATGLVGRAADLAALERLFRDGARLVTLLGPPGIGKTRLALRYAEEVPAFAREGGAWVCDLTEVHTTEDLCRAVMRAGQGRLHTEVVDGSPAGRVGRALSLLGPALVVLDNCEQAVGPVAEALARWLTLAPRARFLVTTRERLQLAAEHVHELGPLSLPGPRTAAADSEAVQLFVARARAVRSDFALTDGNTQAVVALARALDGIPLALELAATRMSLLGPAALLERLEGHLDLLAHPARDVPERQRTLRAAIAGSFDALAPEAQAALREASVFRGGFSLEAAEAVLTRPGRRRQSLVDVLQALRDRSLLHTLRPPGFPEEVRFGLYLSIREFAAQKLAAGRGAGAVRARHAVYFMRFARRWSALLGHGDARAHERLALELENLHAVHAHLVSARSGVRKAREEAVALTLMLEPVLEGTGAATLEAMLDGALARTRLSPAVTCAALRARCDARVAQGRFDAGIRDGEEAVALARKLGEARLLGTALASLGAAHKVKGQMTASHTLLRESLPHLRRSRQPRWEAKARAHLAHVHSVRGEAALGVVEAEKALALAQAAGDRNLVSLARGIMCMALVARGQAAVALGWLEESLAQVRAEGNVRGVSAHLHYLGLLFLDTGDLDRAVVTLREGVEVVSRVGNSREEALTRGLLALTFDGLGMREEAVTEAVRARDLALLRGGDHRSAAVFLATAAAAAAQLGPAEPQEPFLRRARELVEANYEPVLAATVELHAARASVLAAPDEPHRRAAVEAAQALLKRLGETRTPSGEVLLRSAVHVRVAARMLGQTLEAAQAAAAPRAHSGGPADTARTQAEVRPTGVLELTRDGRFCRLPDGRAFTFQRARALRLILLRLFEERLRHPSHALTVRALFEAGWPGEKATDASVQNRVYVAVSRLRRHGLQGILQSRDDGFLLDPTLAARWRGPLPAPGHPQGAWLPPSGPPPGPEGKVR